MLSNKKLGFVLIFVSIVFGLIVISFDLELSEHSESLCSCEAMENGGMCPMDNKSHWKSYLTLAIASAMIALGLYMIFFEKSQQEIIATLEKQKQVQDSEELFNILLKALSSEEKKIMQAIKEQEGITQNTLRLRTDLHKSKLSIILQRLEEKDLIVRTDKGKTKQVFLKIKF